MAVRTPVVGVPVVIRTCVGCGARAAKSDLLRVVAAGDEIVPDPAARMPGRGAYLHPSQGCLERAQRRRAIGRALRLPGSAGSGRLAEYLAKSHPGSGLPGRGGPGPGRAPQCAPEKAG
ncbi:MAG: YlxR family protein [Streptosporangiaceae bacterium]